MSRTALILAAGLGRRLGPKTADRPKALIEVGGITLLERQLRALADAGLAPVLVVTGHYADRVGTALAGMDLGQDVRTIFNPRFADANNIVSFLAAAEDIGLGCILLNSDIVVDPSIIAEVAQAGDGNWLVVDTDEPLAAEEMKVEVDADGRVRHVQQGA